MKKSILLISCALMSIGLMAQSLEFVNFDPVNTSLNGPNDQLMQSYVQVKNNGAIGVTVKVRRHIDVLATNHVANFCFAGYCYVATQDLSLPVDINPGEVTDSLNVTLRSDLNPASSNGVTTISYTAYNTDDESDSVSVTYTYHAGPDGVVELFNGSKNLSNAYPNPADNKSLVAYNLNYNRNAQIIISNMLGSTLGKVLLTENKGTVDLPIAALPDGIYYYTLMNDGKRLASKRLLISHN